MGLAGATRANENRTLGVRPARSRRFDCMAGCTECAVSHYPAVCVAPCVARERRRVRWPRLRSHEGCSRRSCRELPRCDRLQWQRQHEHPGDCVHPEDDGRDASLRAPNRLFQRSVAREPVSCVLNGPQTPNHIAGPSLARPETGNLASKGSVIWGNIE